MNKLFKSKFFYLFGLFFVINLIIGLIVHKHDLGTVLTNTTDSLGYYQYLPSIIIDHDFSPNYYSVNLPNGNALSIFSFGVAVLQLPFFLLGHFFASLFGYEPNGFSAPYAISILVASSFYLSLAFSLLSKYFYKLTSNKLATFITLVTLYFGTNLMYYSAYEFGMSHVYNFFIFSLVIYTHHIVQPINFKNYLLIISFCIGLTLTIKPYNVFGFILLIPFNKNDFKTFIKNIISTWGGTISGIVILSLFVITQILYWHSNTGKYIVFSYGQKGEGFNWLAPELWNILFSPQNGWFVYSPLILLGIIGLFFYFKINKAETFKITIILLLAYYTFASWWAWWFGAAYGHRAFVEFYAFLAIPMSVLISKLIDSNIWVKSLSTIVIMVLIYINISLTSIYQAPWDGPEWGWDDLFQKYKQIF